MKSKTMKEMLMLSLATLALMFLAAMPLRAQSEAESASAELERQSDGRSFKIPVGDRVDYRLQGGSWQRKGLLESVTDTSLTIGGKEVAVQQIERMTHVKTPRPQIGTGLVVGGAIALPISLLLWMVSLLAALDNPSSGERALMLLMGIVTLMVLPVAIIVGIVLLVTGARRFRMSDGWRLRKR